MKIQEAWYRLWDVGFLASRLSDLWFTLKTTRSNEPFDRLYQMVLPYTICGHRRLRGLYEAVEAVVSREIPGDIVECGVARGGSAALMGLALKQLGARRALWAFDTFEGLPPPTPADPDWKIARIYTGTYRGAFEDVASLFGRLGFLTEARLVKGLFQETLPTCALRAIAVLHIDGDWYESVKACLTHLYDRVSPGGIIQIDDYGHWKGARKAVDEFMHQRLPNTHLRRLDYSGRQLVKPRS